MKKIILCCDHCHKNIDENDPYIEMGSLKSHDFYYKNNGKNKKIGGIISLSNYRPIHFCGDKCFTNYFFGLELNDSLT